MQSVFRFRSTSTACAASRLRFLAGILCVAFAASDEFHQTMVANRGPSVKDVGIDSIGVLFGITFVRLFCWIALGGNTKKRKRRRRRYYY